MSNILKKLIWSRLMKMIRFLIGTIFIAFFAVVQVQANNNPLSLTFGIYQSDKATVMYKKFSPVLEYIQNHVSKQLNQSVSINMKIFKTYQQANDAIVSGTVDFVRFGPASYALAKDKNEEIKLLAMEHKKGKKIFKGLIIVPSNSALKSLSELKGKSFAFGNQDSTIGRYLAQAEMIKAGIHAKDLSKYEFLGRHDKVFKAVELGDYDAGAIKEGTYKRYNKKNTVKILHQFNNTTKPWLARQGLDDNVKSAITAALLNLKDKTLLKELKASGFLPATDNDYEFVRQGMRLAEKF